MDISLEYIKQCEKAEEIQEHRLVEGDYYSQKHRRSGQEYEPVKLYLEETGGLRWESLPAIWIPTQDQLQEMIGDYEKCIDMIGWYNETVMPDIGIFEPTSMEQLWLAFVMKEKYGKIWDGSEWIKND